MSLRLISLLVISISCEGREYKNRILLSNSDLTTLEGNTTRRTRDDVHYVKLSPVPFDVEAGSQSPSSLEGTGTQYEVLLAPSAPSNNFVLQPIQHGSNQAFTYNGPYYIDYQGNVVHRPPDNVKPLNFQEAPPVFPHLTDEELTILGQPIASHHTQYSNQPNNNSGPLDDVNGTMDKRPLPGTESSSFPSIGNKPISSVGFSPAPYSSGSSPYLISQSPTIVSFKPSLPSQNQNWQSIPSQNIPATTQQYQYTSQQPTYSAQYAQSGSKYPQNVAVKPSQTWGQQQQTSSYQHAPKPAHQPQLTASSNILTATTGQVIYKPHPPPTNFVPLPPQPSSIKPPGGVYIVTVNNSPNQPSAVFTCFQTHLLELAVLGSKDYSPGPRGYYCKASTGRPFLSNLLLSANSQSPVSQPSVSKDPVPLPTVIPIHFS